MIETREPDSPMASAKKATPARPMRRMRSSAADTARARTPGDCATQRRAEVHRVALESGGASANSPERPAPDVEQNLQHTDQGAGTKRSNENGSDQRPSADRKRASQRPETECAGEHQHAVGVAIHLPDEGCPRRPRSESRDQCPQQETGGRESGLVAMPGQTDKENHAEWQAGEQRGDARRPTAEEKGSGACAEHRPGYEDQHIVRRHSPPRELRTAGVWALFCGALSA